MIKINLNQSLLSDFIVLSINYLAALETVI